MATPLAPELLEVYRRSAREREVRRREALERRRAEALELATSAAHILTAEFGATGVWLYGSLAGVGTFHERSDIDLAVEGVSPECFWKAWAALERLGGHIDIDLADLQFAKASLVAEIQENGIRL